MTNDERCYTALDYLIPPDASFAFVMGLHSSGHLQADDLRQAWEQAFGTQPTEEEIAQFTALVSADVENCHEQMLNYIHT